MNKTLQILVATSLVMASGVSFGERVSGAYSGGYVEELPLRSVPPADASGLNARGSLTYSQTELLQQMDMMQQEVQSLRGQLEQYQKLVRTLRDENKTRYLDLDRRISTLTGQVASLEAVPAAPAIDAAALLANPELLNDPGVLSALDQIAQPVAQPNPVAQPAAELAAPVESVTDAAVDTAALMPEAQAVEQSQPVFATEAPALVVPQSPALAGVESITLPEDEKSAYEASRKLIRDRQFPQAAVALRSFISKFPQGEYIGHAWYWLGEVYMVLPDTPAARQSFEHLIANYPDHAKRPDGTYKLAVVHDQLGDPARAREYLAEVKQKYPGSSAAALADSYMGFMGGAEAAAP